MTLYLFVLQCLKIYEKYFLIQCSRSYIFRDYYICFVKWIDDEHLLIGWSNREQNEAWLSIAQNWSQSNVPDSWVVKQLFLRKSLFQFLLDLP